MLIKGSAVLMDKKKVFSATELNNRDRKVLETYTKLASDFIKSDTSLKSSPNGQNYLGSEKLILK
jgi:hypothetical protein